MTQQSSPPKPYCDVPGSPCRSKNKKITVCIFQSMKWLSTILCLLLRHRPSWWFSWTTHFHDTTKALLQNIFSTCNSFSWDLRFSSWILVLFIMSRQPFPEGSANLFLFIVWTELIPVGNLDCLWNLGNIIVGWPHKTQGCRKVFKCVANKTTLNKCLFKFSLLKQAKLKGETHLVSKSSQVFFLGLPP